jgi:hypothetical protein
MNERRKNRKKERDIGRNKVILRKAFDVWAIPERLNSTAK